MSEAPAELWMRERQRLPGRWYQTHYADEPDAVRYVRADLYEALAARAQQDCLQWLGELGADYPR